jgi:5'-methylthioadenosine phosphorylase
MDEVIEIMEIKKVELIDLIYATIKNLPEDYDCHCLSALEGAGA